MQSLTWYTQRLRAMSAGEVAWRMQSALRDLTEHSLWAIGRPRFPSVAVKGDDHPEVPGFEVTDVAVGEWADAKPNQPEYQWYRRLVAKADKIAAHRFTFFDLVDHSMGSPVDWNRDPKSGKNAPLKFSASIDYRDYNVTGDAKYVWEPNRHHHLVVLARAWRAGGSRRYAEAVVDQLKSWFDQCPFAIGMSWRSPLELGIRLINWVWAFDLIRQAEVMDHRFLDQFLKSVYLHLWEITRKYSRGSSTNNHLIGEAAGVFIATSYFHDLENARSWQKESRDILCREILDQTYGDGGGKEQALGYQFFVIQFFLLTGLVAKKTGQILPAEYWYRLEKMFEFVGSICETGKHGHRFGDHDEGYVLDLGAHNTEIRPWLATAALLFNRPDFKAWAGRPSETTRWLMDRKEQEHFDAMPHPSKHRRIRSRAFTESGYYLLQYENRDPEDQISVIFDCGPLGLKPLCGHGHADALSFVLRVWGEDVVVDPGTYDYFTYPRWRTYFRSTRAHNTVVIDEQDQSVMGGPFLWNTSAEAKCLSWSPDEKGGSVTGEHDGYARLPDPVRHRRTLELNGPERKLIIRDHLVSRGSHQAQLYFHLAEQCRIIKVGPNRYTIDAGLGPVELEFDPQLTVQVLMASENPIGGWVSQGYHHKSPGTTFVARGSFKGNISFVSHIQIGHRWTPEK